MIGWDFAHSGDLGGLQNRKVATYNIVLGRKSIDVSVYLCWDDDKEGADDNRFYDLFVDGRCINDGAPWYDDGKGVPTYEIVEEAIASLLGVSA